MDSTQSSGPKPEELKPVEAPASQSAAPSMKSGYKSRRIAYRPTKRATFIGIAVIIGLLVALGARRRTILGLFLGEAIALSALGGLFGLLIGYGLAQLIHLLVPALPVHTPLSFVLLAEALAISIGLAAGVLPARRAAKLDPVEALRSE